MPSGVLTLVIWHFLLKTHMFILFDLCLLLHYLRLNELLMCFWCPKEIHFHDLNQSCIQLNNYLHFYALIFMLIVSVSFPVKHDCVFGDDLDINEITVVSEVQSNALSSVNICDIQVICSWWRTDMQTILVQVLAELDRPILYSLSPGTSVTPAMAKEVHGLVNMYRITGDDWDTWGDVSAHFNIAR